MPTLDDILSVVDLPGVATGALIAAKLAEVAQRGDRTQPAPRSALLALGMFVFSIDTLAHSELTRRSDWRHATGDRFGARAASQYLGPGADDITLPGVLVPELAGDRSALDTLRDMGATGDSYALVDGDGTILGRFVIRTIDETRRHLFADGAARAVDFTIDLMRVD